MSWQLVSQLLGLGYQEALALNSSQCYISQTLSIGTLRAWSPYELFQQLGPIVIFESLQSSTFWCLGYLLSLTFCILPLSLIDSAVIPCWCYQLSLLYS
jgi:hypothetical protein